jgi:hypothetical protein
MNKNPMIKSCQSKANMVVAEEEVVMVNMKGVVGLPQPHPWVTGHPLKERG